MLFFGDEVFSIPFTVTLVTAKKQNSYVRERAYALAYARKNNFGQHGQHHPIPIPLSITQNQYSFAPLTHLFRQVKMTKQDAYKEKTAQICRFFTLWGYFYPYTNRG